MFRPVIGLAVLALSSFTPSLVCAASISFDDVASRTVVLSGRSTQQASTVEGYVRDREGRAVAHATIRVATENLSVETNSQGFYTIKLPKDGEYELLVSSVAHTVQTKKVKAESGAKISIDWILEVDTRVLTDVEVTGKTSIQKVKAPGFHVDVIDAKQLYNSSADLNQVLNRVPGVRIREDGGLGSNFSFSLNGFSGKQVKFFLDGLPMDNFGSSLTLNNFPTTMAERIEVYKGVLPISLGGDALGGAINLVSRADANFLDLSYGYGSFNTHKVGVNGAYTDAKSGFTFRTNAFYNYSDNNYKVEVSPIDLVTGQTGALQEVERFHDRYASVGAQIELGVSNKTYADKLLFGVMLGRNDKDIQTGVTMDQVYGARTSNSQSIIPTLKYRKTNLFVEGLDVSVYGAYNMTTNNFVDTTRLRYNWLQETVPTTLAEASRTQLKNKDYDGLLTANVSYKLTNNHSFSYNYSMTDFRRRSSDVEDPFNVTFDLPQRMRKHNMGVNWQVNYGGFTATAFSKLYLLHAESFRNVSASSVADYQPTQLNRNYIGYGLAAAYFILPVLQAKASYERAYRLPEPTEFLGDGLFFTGNSALVPEKSHNVNVGGVFTHYFGEKNRLDVEGNFIYRRAEDYIRVDQARFQPTDRRYINNGKVKTTGGELELRYSWSKLLFASVNATYQNIIDDEEFSTNTNLSGTTVTRNFNYGYKVPNIPYLFGNANVGARLEHVGAANNTLTLNYSLNYVEKYYLTPSQLGLNNQDIIPQQIAHNFSADYALLGGKYTVSLEGRNLADNKLYDNYRLQKPGRSFFLKLRYFIN